MINPQWVELSMSRTNFHGPNDVRAIEVRLYIELLVHFYSTLSQCVCTLDEPPKTCRIIGNRARARVRVKEREVNSLSKTVVILHRKLQTS